MEPLQCEWRVPKVSLAEILRCFEHPVSEEQAWAICFQCCSKMEQLAQGLHPLLHAVVIKGPGSVFIHADGTASFKVYQKSDVGNAQELEHKICEEHLSRPSEAASHYKMTCRSLFAEYMELQKLVSIIQISKESLRKMDMEDLRENPLQKKEKYWATLWPDVIRELQNGVKLRKTTERPQHRAPPKEYSRSPYELLVDDIQHKRYTLRKVIIEQKCKSSKVDATASKPHLKSVPERKLKECMPQEPSWHEQLMAEIKGPQKLWPSTARENGSRPKEMPESPNVALKSPSSGILTLQNVSTEFKTVNTVTQQLGPGVQETTPKLPSSTQLASTRSSAKTCNSTGLSADRTCAVMSGPMLGDIKPISFWNSRQQQLPPYRGRSRSLESALQSKELACPFPTKRPSPTIAELIGTRYAMMVLEREGSPQKGGDGAFPRAKICFSCHKQMFLKWPYSCYLCSSVVCSDCCIKMSMPFRMCVHLPLSFLKLLRLSKEEDPATQEQKGSELLHEVEQWACSSVPVMLEPHCLARPLCCYTRTVADWLSVDICTQCEQYLLNMASSQQQNISLGRISRSWTKLE
ncbi:protein spire homolog 1-like isoform X2 [Struthio camelus]|uniref:protein spire homolog 1-like isoform X2 n=1 Tax=Struthio camelus TaxID=8801 RepID=UPI003603B27C